MKAAGLALALALTGAAAFAGTPAALPFQVEGLDPGSGQLPNTSCFNPDQQQGTDRSLGLYWSAAPAGTKSLAVLMTDSDAPQDLSLLRKPDLISQMAPRQTVYHWVLVDIPASRTSLPAGIDGNDTLIQGKLPGKTDHGLRGLNFFTKAFAQNPDWAGQYGGYDGPFPPVNDMVIHHYHIRVFALDVASLGLSPDGNFGGKAAEKAMRGHILAVGEVVGLYTNNPSLRN